MYSKKNGNAPSGAFLVFYAVSLILIDYLPPLCYNIQDDHTLRSIYL